MGSSPGWVEAQRSRTPHEVWWIREPNVLLVEDNPGDVRLVQEAFEGADIESELHVVPDGIAALSFLRREGDHAEAPRPDIVLLDLNLPRTGGDELLSELNEDPTWGASP